MKTRRSSAEITNRTRFLHSAFDLFVDDWWFHIAVGRLVGRRGLQLHRDQKLGMWAFQGPHFNVLLGRPSKCRQ